MKKFIIIITMPFCLAMSCDEETGCTDSQALNHSYSAEQDDGSCEYSSATFYASVAYFSGIPITKIDLSINGSAEGSITAFYPNGPGNCSAQGTVLYEFQDGDAIDWNTIVHLANGGTVFDSGTLSPSSIECIKVNVTN